MVWFWLSFQTALIKLCFGMNSLLNTVGQPQKGTALWSSPCVIGIWLKMTSPKLLSYPLSEELWGNFCCVRILCRLHCRKMCVSLKQWVYFYLMQNYFITNYILTSVCLIEYSELYLGPTFSPFAEMYTFISEFLVSSFFAIYKPHFLYYLISKKSKI